MEKIKFFTLVLGLILLYSSGYSQGKKADTSRWSDNLTYGIKAGVAFSAFTHDLEPFTGKKAGLVAGGFAEYRFLDFLSLSVEPGYIQKGALLVDPGFLYDDPLIYDPYHVVEVSGITSHHVQVPVIISLRIPGNDCCAEPFLNIGATAAYTFYVEADNLVDYGIMNDKKYYESVEEGITDRFKDWEYQALAGAGIEFKYPAGNIIFNLQYCIGLSKINKYSYQNQFYDFSSNSWIITTGFRFK